MAMTRLSDATPRMTLSRALLSEALRLARSPLAAVWNCYTRLGIFQRDNPASRNSTGLM